MLEFDFNDVIKEEDFLELSFSPPLHPPETHTQHTPHTETDNTSLSAQNTHTPHTHTSLTHIYVPQNTFDWAQQSAHVSPETLTLSTASTDTQQADTQLSERETETLAASVAETVAPQNALLSSYDFLTTDTASGHIPVFSTLLTSSVSFESFLLFLHEHYPHYRCQSALEHARARLMHSFTGVVAKTAPYTLAPKIQSVESTMTSSSAALIGTPTPAALWHPPAHTRHAHAATPGDILLQDASLDELLEYSAFTQCLSDSLAVYEHISAHTHAKSDWGGHRTHSLAAMLSATATHSLASLPLLLLGYGATATRQLDQRRANIRQRPTAQSSPLQTPGGDFYVSLSSVTPLQRPLYFSATTQRRETGRGLSLAFDRTGAGVSFASLALHSTPTSAQPNSSYGYMTSPANTSSAFSSFRPTKAPASVPSRRSHTLLSLTATLNAVPCDFCPYCAFFAQLPSFSLTTDAPTRHTAQSQTQQSQNDTHSPTPLPSTITRSSSSNTSQSSSSSSSSSTAFAPQTQNTLSPTQTQDIQTPTQSQMQTPTPTVTAQPHSKLALLQRLGKKVTQQAQLVQSSSALQTQSSSTPPRPQSQHSLFTQSDIPLSYPVLSSYATQNFIPSQPQNTYASQTLITPPSQQSSAASAFTRPLSSSAHLSSQSSLSSFIPVSAPAIPLSSLFPSPALSFLRAVAHTCVLLYPTGQTLSLPPSLRTGYIATGDPLREDYAAEAEAPLGSPLSPLLTESNTRTHSTAHSENLPFDGDVEL